ncbi:solute carrier family 7 (cationic amino acid transporter, y+ system), member 6 [Stanieria cyanosphaera PCC 7437]|uniref:Solute carrier family 7 (Cationic amino acid transporter, y+ system), member 6 n=1 Tax=Stanieria cyanosphaera (strain ATCC 29371 / PCC 7437) TaxID=111780 RepID=K9XTS9_STAC7|nr:hypothetical protein [Stanieria cyanosphaera]AFZ35953.1 solute carrier family 7 (cationic amino acid transporter, y+ system), member 6 [Stanieria cyanosphaera PCC 7437]
MSWLIFLLIGLILIWIGLKVSEEVVQLSTAITAAILLVWGLVLTPQSLLLLIEIITILAVFRICMRCCECD